MEVKEKPERKQLKILKCTECGKEYIFDSASQYCPECRGLLKQETVTP